ncbi:MAG TPA: alginate export family protein [Lacunisphaera sp.]|nr:alginate export family protein [Lacunisphaera sp.]
MNFHAGATHQPKPSLGGSRPWRLAWALGVAISLHAAAEPRIEGNPPAWELKAETRFRYEVRDQAGNGEKIGRLLAREVLGARVGTPAGWRAYAELASGQVSNDRLPASASIQNDLSLQQLWLEGPILAESLRLSARVGRQEFDDGPRQLVSVGDGPNLHRTWNGVKVCANVVGADLSAFAFRATRLGRDGLDERISRTERLGGLTGSVAVPGAGGSLRLDPFWLRSETPGIVRNTFGAAARGERGRVSIDWVAAVQSSHVDERDRAAWAVFATQSLELTGRGWRPRLSLRIDAASAGRSGRERTTGGFDQLYASSSYLGEGLFLSASNLLLISPGLSFTPATRTKLAVDYGFARRLDERDAAYAGQMRAYPGTAAVPGREIGGLLRVQAGWTPSRLVLVGVAYEHLARGDVLARAGLPSRSYVHASVTFRH